MNFRFSLRLFTVIAALSSTAWTAGSVFVIGFGLFNGVLQAEENAAKQQNPPQESPRPQDTASKKQYNWAAPRLVPVDVEVNELRVTLRAGGESVVFDGILFHVDATAELTRKWKKETIGSLNVFSLELQAQKPALIKEVQWFAGRWTDTDETAIQRTNLQDNFFFLRKGRMSFFLSLDFPYSKITLSSISYPANEPLAAGSSYSCHTITVGACALSGVRVGEFDRAEIEAASAYVEERFPMRFERPMFMAGAIANRTTDVRDGRVFYSSSDQPSLELNPHLLEEEIRLCGEMGIEYLQIYEGVFDWTDEAKTGETLRRMTKLAKPLGVRLGDYTDVEGLYCGVHMSFFNYEHRTLQALNHPQWFAKDKDGKDGRFCLGCREYVDWLCDNLVEHNRKYGEEIVDFDFLGIGPCYHAGHGHPAGDVYQQVRGLVSICSALNALSPDFLVWSNSGNWIEWMPKLVWYNPNVYLTDAHFRAYAPFLNTMEGLDNSRREQMVSLHDRNFIPFRCYGNFEYFFAPRSRVHDLRVFEYGILQGLAVTPNLGVGEYRTFFNRIPGPKRQECVAFIERWSSFVRKHFDVWKHTAVVGDAPGIGAAEIYAHIKDDHGFICFVNQNPFPRTARFRLDSSIGLATGRNFQLSEAYPNECPIIEQEMPFASFGQEIACILPPKSVRFVEIKPNPGLPDTLSILGLPAKVEKTASGYLVRVSAQQGELVKLGLILPAGQAIDAVSARQKPTVKMYTFPVSARLVEQSGNLARVEVQFPRDRAPRELTRWKVTPSDVQVTLPMMGSSHFLGGLVYGAFSEPYEVELDVKTKQDATMGSLPSIATPVEPEAVPLPKAPKQTFVTTFRLPFIETMQYGCMPGYDDDAVLELAFDGPDVVKTISARISGKPIEVRKYTYPRNGYPMCSYYIELTGNVEPGDIELAMDVEWK